MSSRSRTRLAYANIDRCHTACWTVRRRERTLVAQELNDVVPVDQRDPVVGTVLKTLEVEGESPKPVRLIWNRAGERDDPVEGLGRAVVANEGPAVESCPSRTGDFDELIRIGADVVVMNLVNPRLSIGDWCDRAVNDTVSSEETPNPVGVINEGVPVALMLKDRVVSLAFLVVDGILLIPGEQY